FAISPNTQVASCLTRFMTPGNLRVRASLDSDDRVDVAAELGVTRLHQILPADREFPLLRRVPAAPDAPHPLIADILKRQFRYIAKRGVHFQSLRQIEQRLKLNLMMRTRTIVRPNLIQQVARKSGSLHHLQV